MARGGHNSLGFPPPWVTVRRPTSLSANWGAFGESLNLRIRILDLQVIILENIFRRKNKARFEIKMKFTPHVNFALISNTKKRKMDFWQILNFSPSSPWAQASCGNGVLDLGLVTLAAHGAAMPTWALSPRRHKLLTPPLTNTLTLTHSKTLSFLTNRMVQNMAEVNLGANSSLAGRIYVFRPSLRSVHQAWSRS